LPTANTDGDRTASARDLTAHELAKHLPRVVWINDSPWGMTDRVLRPMTMPHVGLSPDRRDLRKAIAEHGALLAVWTSEWDSLDASSPWWWTCCDQQGYEFDRIDSSRGRRSIRKGLRECEVRQVPSREFGPLAYPIHAAAVRSYGQPAPDEAVYLRHIEQMAAYPGTAFWAAFHGDCMAAFATCQVVDQAVSLGTTKSDPELDKHNPNAALFYTIAEHYLDRGILYVSNGWRPLWHPTRINDFLETLGFRKVYCRVNVVASGKVRLLDRTAVARWGRFLGLERLLGKRWLQLQGLHRLLRIAETFE